MMDNGLKLLIGTAATIGSIHTILGPDHYLPFAAIAKARRWTNRKMLTITILCGLGHVLGSITLGILGIALGWAVGSMESIEAACGDWAAWALIGFGLAYGAWGIRQGIRRKPHTHLHVHQNGIAHVHSHAHVTEHSHVHDEAQKASITPWMMFIVFVLGPCEPLIPILMVPASQHNWGGVALVSGVFAATTIVTMMSMVLVVSKGSSFLRVNSLERWAHALAGFSLFACGGAIKWLGL